MKRGWEGRIVKGNRNNQTISGVITKSKRHYCDNNEVEIVLAEVLRDEAQKKLEVDLNTFLNSVDRVASVSLDKKDGVKFSLSKDNLNLSVNNTNSGDGKESLIVKFDDKLDISFNSRYLIDVASQLDGERVEIFFNDTGSPALIKDPGDFDSIFVVMPMKG